MKVDAEKSNKNNTTGIFLNMIALFSSKGLISITPAYLKSFTLFAHEKSHPLDGFFFGST